MIFTDFWSDSDEDIPVAQVSSNKTNEIKHGTVDRDYENSDTENHGSGN